MACYAVSPASRPRITSQIETRSRETPQTRRPESRLFVQRSGSSPRASFRRLLQTSRLESLEGQLRRRSTRERRRRRESPRESQRQPRIFEYQTARSPSRCRKADSPTIYAVRSKSLDEGTSVGARRQDTQSAGSGGRIGLGERRFRFRGLWWGARLGRLDAIHLFQPIPARPTEQLNLRECLGLVVPVSPAPDASFFACRAPGVPSIGIFVGRPIETHELSSPQRIRKVRAHKCRLLGSVRVTLNEFLSHFECRIADSRLSGESG